MKAPRIDFLITNDGHHSAMFLPLIRVLRERGEHELRVVSLCEFRGLPSPDERYAAEGVPLVRAMRRNVRPSPATGSQRAGRAARALRGAARWLSWQLVLRRPLAAFFGPGTDLAVLPNDGGFPYAQICRHLRRGGTPFLMVQEGIRFRQPHATDQGQGGADFLAVWGESSAAYYRRQGAPPESIVIAGNPRFEDVLQTDWRPAAEAVRRELGLRGRTVLLLTNPIEDLGFGTTREKLELVRRFAADLEPLAADPRFRLVVKLHRRESRQRYEEALAGLPITRRAVVLDRAELYPLLAAADAAVVMASSAGLEALLLGLPLGVLEIPGFGFAHDYVSSGAALGLDRSSSAAEQLRRLLTPSAEREVAVRRYLDRTLAERDSSTGRILELIERALAGDGGGAPPPPLLPTHRMIDLWRRQHPAAEIAGEAFGIPLVRRGRALHNIGGRDFPGFFLDPAASASAHRPRLGRRAELLAIHDLPLDGEACRRLAAEPGAVVEPLYDCPVIQTGGDWRAYLDTRLSKRTRQRLKRSRRRLESLGSTRLVWTRAEELDGHFERFFRLLSERAVSRREHDRNLWRRDYLHAIWRELLGDELLVSVLTLDGVPISFRTGFRLGRRFVGYMPVADAAFAPYSVGRLHLYLLLAELQSMGMDEYDFSKGTSPSKEAWSSKRYTLALATVPLRPRALTGLRLRGLGAAARLRRWGHARGLAGLVRRARFLLARTTDRRFAAGVRELSRRGPAIRQAPAPEGCQIEEFSYREIASTPLAFRATLLDHLWRSAATGGHLRLGRHGSARYLEVEGHSTVLTWVPD